MCDVLEGPSAGGNAAHGTKKSTQEKKPKPHSGHDVHSLKSGASRLHWLEKFGPDLRGSGDQQVEPGAGDGTSHHDVEGTSGNLQIGIRDEMLRL